jgi:hypothetical protein
MVEKETSGCHKEFVSNDGLLLKLYESTSRVLFEGKDGREVTKADLAQRLIVSDELLKFLRSEKNKAA